MTFKLEIGKSYLSRGGEKVTITVYNSGDDYPFSDKYGVSYNVFGEWFKGYESDLDLISEISEQRSEDCVNRPVHYSAGSIECIDAIQSQLTPEEFRGFLKGNIAKYLWREKGKQGKISLEKAQWYLNKLLGVYNG